LAPSGQSRMAVEGPVPRMSVLIAEDNDASRRLVGRLLEEHGHVGISARTGKEVLSLYEQGTFDLILMDIQMRDMDGLQATAEIRERESVKGGHIPIIALTAHAIKGDRERFLGAGMDGYLSKPIQAGEFMEAIERVKSTASVDA